MSTRASVSLWGTKIGAVLWGDRGYGIFEYTPEFIEFDIEVAPFTMPARPGPIDFPGLSKDTFKGLPGMLSDSLPDKFGNLLIDQWLAAQGRDAASFNPVERLCYTGNRGMGALEYTPDGGPKRNRSRKIEIEPLVDLANRVLSQRAAVGGTLAGQDDHKDLEDILVIGTSAGGARAKAVIAWNEKTGEFRSGQVKADPGFTQWLLKFDGVDENSDKELKDPKGFGRMEYAFSELARDADVTMSRCRLHEEGGRAHFMTKRFDRTDDGDKLHMQSLGALRHFDFNVPQGYSYEQAIETIRALRLPQEDVVEQVRRAFLNLAIRNQDDHVKNIAFLMDRDGQWALSPAFDVTYAYNPSGPWTAKHQMTLNGKADGFTTEDLMDFGRFADMRLRDIRDLIGQIGDALTRWDQHAEAAGVPEDLVRRSRNGFRWELFGKKRPS
ncbi:MAG: type II toxin-antitoxin system HipA family toxin [Loktanella sp.]|nr:type II toxin-antitoxin system HipA family toxin [Loktanella sp.]